MKAMFIYRSRRYVVLIEVIIAMTLTVALLTLLMGFYSQVERINIAAGKAQNKSFQKLYLSTRLADILPKTLASSDSKKDFIFYTPVNWDGVSQSGTPSLLFSFNNGVRLASEFSDHVIGKLYVDKNGALSLGMWPSFLRWNQAMLPPMKNEVLMENVEQFQIEFYVPPHRDRKIIWDNNKADIKASEALQLDNLGGWRTEWHQEYKELPVLIRLTLKVKTVEGPEEIVLVYPLPNSHLFIMYER